MKHPEDKAKHCYDKHAKELACINKGGSMNPSNSPRKEMGTKLYSTKIFSRCSNEVTMKVGNRRSLPKPGTPETKNKMALYL